MVRGGGNVLDNEGGVYDGGGNVLHCARMHAPTQHVWAAWHDMAWASMAVLRTAYKFVRFVCEVGAH